MTYNNHPITPPPELVEQWCYEDGDEIRTSPRWYQRVCAKAARWGADQELEACCKWVSQFDYDDYSYGGRLQVARRGRTTPPSLKAQALEALKHAEEGWRPVPADCEIIRRALERLQELEVQVEAQVND